MAGPRPAMTEWVTVSGTWCLVIAEYVESDEVVPGIILDFDAQGNVIGIEVLDVKLRIAGRYPASAKKRAAAE